MAASKIQHAREGIVALGMLFSRNIFSEWFYHLFCSIPLSNSVIPPYKSAKDKSAKDGPPKRSDSQPTKQSGPVASRDLSFIVEGKAIEGWICP